MKSKTTYRFLFLSLILLLILACNVARPVPTATFSALPPTPISLGEQVTFSTVSQHETSQNPAYEINVEIPTLQGNTDARVVNFNTAMNNLVNHEVDAFKKNVSQIPADPNFMPSSLDVSYALLLQDRDLLSIKFDFSFYSSGAAHPGLYSITVNYDLGQGRELALSDLFLPNSNFLEVISNDCIAELSKQPFFEGPFAEGAQPTPENYHNWNITADGLLITFDEYQVAPYAAGPQKVTVPYDRNRFLLLRVAARQERPQRKYDGSLPRLKEILCR
jgi:hypothetical protein